MTTQTIRGTTKECLAHFARAAGINYCGRNTPKSVYPIRNGLSDLLGVDWATGYTWFGKNILPIGVNLIKLRYLLELAGYTVAERETLPEEQRHLADLLALDVLSVQAVAEFVRVNDQAILRWAIGRADPLGSNVEAIGRLWNSDYQKSARDAQRRWQETLQKLDLLPVSAPTPVRETGPRVSPTSSVTAGERDRQNEVEILSHLILAAKPLAEQVLSDQFSEQDRGRLRQLTTNGRSNGVFELANLLNRLCGERARREIAPPLATSQKKGD